MRFDRRKRFADAVIVVPDANAVANLGDHAGAAIHDAVQHLTVCVEIARGASPRVAHMYVRERGPGIVAIVELLNDLGGLLGQVGVCFLAVQPAGGGHGEDDLFRVVESGFHGRFLQ